MICMGMASVSGHRERQQREHPRAADRGRDHALLARARSADPARDHLAAVGDERPQDLRVLVIDLGDDLVGQQLAANRAARALAGAAVIAVAIEALFTGIHARRHGLLLFLEGRGPRNVPATPPGLWLLRPPVRAVVSPPPR